MEYTETFTGLNNDEFTIFYKDEALQICHKEDGPAVISKFGHKEWFVNNLLHRVDGPAVIYANGKKEYWLNGEEYYEEEYWAIVRLGAFV